MADAIITLRHSGTQVQFRETSSSLLTTLEANQVCVEYQCREGYCGSCRTRLLKGQVCYLTEPLAFIQQGEILPCCCQPQGDLEIDL